MGANESASGPVEHGPSSQSASSQRKNVASSDINLSRIENIQDVFTSWHKGNPGMGLLVPTTT